MTTAEMNPGLPQLESRFLFSFLYGGRHSDELLDDWQTERTSETLDADRTKLTITWTDPETGLRVSCESIRYSDFPAVEWLLYFENAGASDTPIVQDIQALDLVFRSPLSADIPYLLHRTNGGPANPTDFEPQVLGVTRDQAISLGAAGGLSSSKDLPFLKIATGGGPVIVAIGWSGQWQARCECLEGERLRITAGMEKTHFLLHPGEKVRSPRILIGFWKADAQESNAQFRQLIYKHYAAVRAGKKPLPTLFCNSAFTRPGPDYWLNDCNAENQISLIKAYAPLQLEALITDAGWFEGGWPNGAGNWSPRKDAYPEGMRPVAAAAKATGTIYGLWFEPERAVPGTWISENHPEWLLPAGDESDRWGVAVNFGQAQVSDYFFRVVGGFLDLPAFRVYRQDCNIAPLAGWQRNDPPDRQGISEIKHIQGLYAYWDRIAETWPDSLREECASGGNRIDLETVMRMHIHQKTDYWFDNEVDQASIWGLSQYLPNNVFVAHLNQLDDYSFHSTMAASLCLGWNPDAADFDLGRGKELLDRYRQVRDLLIGAWYPLLPYSRDLDRWMASQYHRPDLDEGMVLVFRRAESPYRTVELSLRALDESATYELRFDRSGMKAKMRGHDLMNRFEVNLDQPHSSDLITYRKTAA